MRHRVSQVIENFRKKRKLNQGQSLQGTFFKQSRDTFKHLSSFFDMKKLYDMIKNENILKPLESRQKKKFNLNKSASLHL